MIILNLSLRKKLQKAKSKELKEFFELDEMYSRLEVSSEKLNYFKTAARIFSRMETIVRKMLEQSYYSSLSENDRALYMKAQKYFGFYCK